MNPRRLKWLTIVLPVLFGIVFLFLREEVYGTLRIWYVELGSVVLLVTGAYFFSSWVFSLIRHREREIRLRTGQLSALHDASIVLTRDLELPNVLNRVVSLSRELVNAKFGALGVMSENGKELEQFIVSGISPDEHSIIGALPAGGGILGLVIEEGKPIRIDHMADDPRTVGFPEFHPSMDSFLGVPIQFKGKVIGNLYLTDKQRSSEQDGDGEGTIPFSDEDEKIVEMFATQAAIAIENAQLLRNMQQLVVLQERERFAMDLHDGIIQSIYAVGLMLEDAQHRLQSNPQTSNQEIQKAISGLNGVIRDIRNYILDLRPERFEGRDLRRGVEELSRDLKANTFLDVEFSWTNVDFSIFSPEQTVEILHIIQEALVNIRRHARAVHVDIDMTVEDGRFETRISDDGIGVRDWDPKNPRGSGIVNMKERASALGGEVTVAPGGRVGTVVIFVVPIKNLAAP